MVDGLRCLSSSTYRSHSAAASANVAPVRSWPANVPRCASCRTSRSQSSTRRFVKYPVGGRPRPVHAAPSFFWTYSGHAPTSRDRQTNRKSTDLRGFLRADAGLEPRTPSLRGMGRGGAGQVRNLLILRGFRSRVLVAAWRVERDEASTPLPSPHAEDNASRTWAANLGTVLSSRSSTPLTVMGGRERSADCLARAL